MANHKSAIKPPDKILSEMRSTAAIAVACVHRSKSFVQPSPVTIKMEASELLGATVSVIDKAVNKVIIHKNTAARYKSRLTKHVSELA